MSVSGAKKKKGLTPRRLAARLMLAARLNAVWERWDQV